MDNVSISKQPAQISDYKGHQVIENCLNNSVVVRKIFQFFSSRELIKLSVLTKMWNFEARSVMRERGNLIARVRCDASRPSQGNFEAFLADTQQMNIVPFSGISIDIHHRRGSPCPNAAPDPTYEFIFDQLQLKKVSIVLFEESKDCPVILFAKTVLTKFSGVLEELTLTVLGRQKDFIEQIVQECRFARLKVLELQGDYFHSHAAWKDMKEMMSHAPTLQELHTAGPMNLVVDTLEGSSSVIIVYKRTAHAPFDEIMETSISALRLKQMELFYTGPEFNFAQFNRITPMLLQASCTKTLEHMAVNSVLLVPLMCFGVCLENVRHIDIHINYRHLEQHEPWILRIVKDFDFTRIFPRFPNVTIIGDGYPFDLSPDHRDGIIEQANAVLRERRRDRAANVKHVDLQRCNLSNVSVMFFAEMFPNIRCLEVMALHREEIEFGSIWRHWVDLEELVVQGYIIESMGNLDSVFCGIFPEEVAELRQKDDAYLKRVNIVPVMPSMTCISKLRTLTMYEDTIINNRLANDVTLMFSKVTALIAFARCPALAVNLHFLCCPVVPEMSHLKPYVTVHTLYAVAVPAKPRQHQSTFDNLHI